MPSGIDSGLVGTVRQCEKCGAEYAPKRHVQRYCSPECANRVARINYYRTEQGQKVYEACRHRYEKTEKGKANNRNTVRRWRENNPEKRLAQNAVHNATRNGTLSKPSECSECGEKGRVEGHHHMGYGKERLLDVQWLCRACHIAAHSAAGEEVWG